VVIANYALTKTLVHAFIISCLDYCNGLSYGVSDELLQKLHVIRDCRQTFSELSFGFREVLSEAVT